MNRRDANQRERTWYVACIRVRDILIVPHTLRRQKTPGSALSICVSMKFPSWSFVLCASGNAAAGLPAERAVFRHVCRRTAVH